MKRILNNILGEIPYNWEVKKFDEVVDLIHGYQFRSHDFTKDGIKVFKITQIKGEGIIDISNCDFIDSSRLKDFRRNIISYNDILMALTGATIGKIARFRSKEVTLQNYRVGKFKSKDTQILSEDYLYYFLSSKLFFHQLLARQTQSAQQNIGKEDINNMTICFPDLPIQKTISEILSSLDGKIELNNQINQNLEALAQALFKQWFVDFEFPNENGEPYKSSGGEMVDSELGEIPMGWSVVNLDKLLTIKYGKDHKGIPEGQIPIYGSGGVMRFGNRSLYEKASILIPRKGTLTNLFFITDPFWSVDTMFYSEIHSDEFAEFLFFWIKSLDIASMNVGSAVPSMTTKVLNQLLVLKPDENTIRAFHEFAKGVFDTTKANIKENENLKKLRDTLLPKLISGELEVLDFQEISPTLERQV
jgi:type I restriction enzyme S subunit